MRTSCPWGSGLPDQTPQWLLMGGQLTPPLPPHSSFSVSIFLFFSLETKTSIQRFFRFVLRYISEFYTLTLFSPSSRGCFLCSFSFFVHAHLYVCASVDMRAGPALQPLLPSHVSQALASSTGLQGTCVLFHQVSQTVIKEKLYVYYY